MRGREWPEYWEVRLSKTQTTRSQADADSRRDFVKKAGKVAVAAPATAVLLSAGTIPARAERPYGPPNGTPRPPA